MINLLLSPFQRNPGRKMHHKLKQLHAQLLQVDQPSSTSRRGSAEIHGFSNTSSVSEGESTGETTRAEYADLEEWLGAVSGNTQNFHER